MVISELVPLSPEQDKEFNYYYAPVFSGAANFGMKLKADGETVVAARVDVGYWHRGIEKLMESRTAIQNAVLTDRICMYEALNWNLVHAEAVEELAGIEVPERARYIRVIMAELSRIQSHLVWFAAMSMGMGFNPGFELAMKYRDFILGLFGVTTGGRVYPAGYICPGGVRRDLPLGSAAGITVALEEIEAILPKIVEHNDRMLAPKTKGVGILKLDDARRLGATGPVLRGSGMAADVRKDDPYEIYDQLEYQVAVSREGDAYARNKVRLEEIGQSARIIKQLLAAIPEGPVKNTESLDYPLVIPQGEVYARNEMPRGEGTMHMVGNGGYAPYRCKIKTADLLHGIPVLEHMVVGSSTADIPAIFWSLDIYPGAIDR